MRPLLMHMFLSLRAMGDATSLKFTSVKSYGHGESASSKMVLSKGSENTVCYTPVETPPKRLLKQFSNMLGLTR